MWGVYVCIYIYQEAYIYIPQENYFLKLAHRIVRLTAVNPVGQVGRPETHAGFLCSGKPQFLFFVPFI